MMKRVWHDKVKESFSDILFRICDWISDEMSQDNNSEISVDTIMDWLSEAIDIDGLTDDFHYYCKLELSFDSIKQEKKCHVWITAFARATEKSLVGSFLLELPVNANLKVGMKENGKLWQLIMEYTKNNSFKVEY